MGLCKSNNSELLWKLVQAPINKTNKKPSVAYLPAITVCLQQIDKSDFSKADFDKKDFK